MLKRLYIDNYKCLVNFDFAPQRTQLILGANGTGKSTVFDVLHALRQFVGGNEKVAQLFPATSLTRWESRDRQQFEMEVEGNGGTYHYQLTLEHRIDTRQVHVWSEQLQFHGRPLLRFAQGEITIFHENQRAGTTFPFDWNQSAFATLAERQDNRLHRWFRDWVGQLQVVRINAFAMVSQTDREDPKLDKHMTNFASWYRHLVQDAPELIEQLRQSLGTVWGGFQGLRLEAAGPSVRLLKAVLRGDSAEGGRKYELAFDELSDGQRALIRSYTLLRYAERSTSPLICIDEPDNFVSLAEIQPWLLSMCQAVEDHGSQALFISHHPELINYLAPQDAIVLSRAEAGPTRVRPFQASDGSTLTPAEVIARGWDHE